MELRQSVASCSAVNSLGRWSKLAMAQSEAVQQGAQCLLPNKTLRHACRGLLQLPESRLHVQGGTRQLQALLWGRLAPRQREANVHLHVPHAAINAMR